MNKLPVVLLLIASGAWAQIININNPNYGCQPKVSCIEQHSPGVYVEIRQGPLDPGVFENFEWTLPHEMQLQMVDAWIGTAYSVDLETGSHFRIIWPNGRFIEFLNEFDKHHDEHGEKQRSWNVHYFLPKGTKLQVWKRAEEQCLPETDPDFYNLAYPVTCSPSADYMWRLYGSDPNEKGQRE
jgi:hypothetical protein